MSPRVLPRLGCQVDDLELLALLLTLEKVRFCGTLFAELADGAIVFRTELLL